MNTARYLTYVLLSAILATPYLAAADDSIAVTGTSGYLPVYLLEMPGSVSDVLIADAESATLRRFVHSSDSYVEKDQRYMSIGQNGAGKQRAWDRKTPLGVYFVTERLDTSKLHDKYGVAAYPLDYPNAWDRQKRRTGGGIWLHGVDHKHPDRPPLDTDGCLALPNEQISLLADVIEPLVTPVIVAREVVWATPDELETTRLEFRLVLEIWKNSMASGDLKTYLSLYADDFHYRNMDKEEWSSYRLGVFESRQLEDVTINDVMLLADPEEPDLFLSRFTQVLVTDTGPVTTTKRLYWRREASDRWEIVSEDSG